MCDQFLLEICKLQVFATCKACDLSQIFASPLSLIRRSHYVSLWLNTVAAVQMIFIERIFVFFMTLFLKKMGIILSASKPQCHSRLSKLILKVLSIYRKNILQKQLSPAMCSKYVFRLLPAPKFQVFSSKLNMIVKVVKLLAVVLRKRCPDNFIGKHLYRSAFFNNFHAYALLKDSCAGVFLWVLPSISERFFWQNTSVWLLLLNTPFLIVTSTSTRKTFPSTLVILNIFETNTEDCLQTAPCGGPAQTVRCD